MKHIVKVIFLSFLFISTSSSSQSAINFSINISSLPSCSTCCDGVAVVPYLSITGGCNQPYYYLWSTGSTASSDNNFCYNNTYSVTVYDICDSTTKAFTFPIYTAINEFEIFKNLKIYPNPVRNKLNLDFEDQKNLETKISIINSLGQIVYALDNTSQKQVLDLSFLATGIYYLKIQDTSGQKVFKVVKE